MQSKLEVLKAIRELGRPTVREIGERVGLAAPSVYHHMETLREDGYITWETGKARTIQLTPEGRDQFQTV